MTRVVDPLGGTTSFAWTSGLLNAITDANGHRVTLTYASLANRTQRLQSIARPGIGRFSFVYDANSRVATLIDRKSARTTLLWDANGNRKTLIDPFGGRYTTAYNSAGQIVQSTDPLGHTTALRYDAVGAPTVQIDCAGPASFVRMKPGSLGRM